jgi:hypothetical protein
MYGIIVRRAFLYKPSILILSASRSQYGCPGKAGTENLSEIISGDRLCYTACQDRPRIGRSTHDFSAKPKMRASQSTKASGRGLCPNRPGGGAWSWTMLRGGRPCTAVPVRSADLATPGRATTINRLFLAGLHPELHRQALGDMSREIKAMSLSFAQLVTELRTYLIDKTIRNDFAEFCHRHRQAKGHSVDTHLANL